MGIVLQATNLQLVRKLLKKAAIKFIFKHFTHEFE